MDERCGCYNLLFFGYVSEKRLLVDHSRLSHSSFISFLFVFNLTNGRQHPKFLFYQSLFRFHIRHRLLLRVGRGLDILVLDERCGLRFFILSLLNSAR